MSSWLRRVAQKPLTAGFSACFSTSWKALSRDVEPITLQQPLVVCLADRQERPRVDDRRGTRPGAAGTGLRLDGLSQLSKRLVEVAAIGRSEDVHSLGEEGHRGRGRPAFERLVCNRLGLPEQVVGDRQPEDQLVRFLRIPWGLPRRKLAQLVETLFFQLQKLAVVFVVDLLSAGRALAGSHDLGLCRCRLILGGGIRPGGDCLFEHNAQRDGCRATRGRLL